MEEISKKDLELLQKKYPNNIDELLKRINDGYPVQYLIGNVEFLNTIIDVNEAVLIPRFETELLVDKTIKLIKEKYKKQIKILDIGTGSGCIAIALKKNVNASVIGIDISAKAIETAKRNAIQNSTDVLFLVKDIHEKIDGKYDIIISNPPYIANDGYVADSVKKYEPNVALYANDNGLYFYKYILDNFLNNLNDGGMFIFEIGDNQKILLEDILKKYSNISYRFEKDLNNRYRYLFIDNE